MEFRRSRPPGKLPRYNHLYQRIPTHRNKNLSETNEPLPLYPPILRPSTGSNKGTNLWHPTNLLEAKFQANSQTSNTSHASSIIDSSHEATIHIRQNKYLRRCKTNRSSPHPTETTPHQQNQKRTQTTQRTLLSPTISPKGHLPITNPNSLPHYMHGKQ